MMLATVGLQNSEFDLNARRADCTNAPARNLRMGISTAHNDATDPGAANRLGAWTGAALKSTGLQSDSQAGSTKSAQPMFALRLGQRLYFSVSTTRRLRPAATEDSIPSKHHRPHGGVWANTALTSSSPGEGPPHLGFIVQRPVHPDSSSRRSRESP